MIKELAVLAAAVSLSGFASAASVVIPTTRPITLTYDSSLFNLQYAYGGRCLDTDTDRNCFNVALAPIANITSGSIAAEFELAATDPLALTNFSSGLNANLLAEPSDVELRFSNPTVNRSGSIVDVDTNATLATNSFYSYVWLSQNASASKRIKVRFAFDFIPGNFLRPSADSNCASLSCMTPGHDTAYVYGVTLMTSAIPEPSTYAMLVAGGLALLFANRRPQRR
ncbi:hypothetical protein J2X16_002772 [Pelomonas aquatica]|uniref:PEP-CTERM protein-sorting domain-containing protein n=1 Tax=Pelomonas aquatica TaxID=431058 RepID=A0ABU1Z9X1_9BURK|nr:PEP-CTERM sorting domain-containing protein [Pelomonas aquatica]MDR7297423.1 hypothetical protein [Pelomonas aquatica]